MKKTTEETKNINIEETQETQETKASEETQETQETKASKETQETQETKASEETQENEENETEHFLNLRKLLNNEWGQKAIKLPLNTAIYTFEMIEKLQEQSFEKTQDLVNQSYQWTNKGIEWLADYSTRPTKMVLSKLHDLQERARLQ